MKRNQAPVWSIEVTPAFTFMGGTIKVLIFLAWDLSEMLVPPYSLIRLVSKIIIVLSVVNSHFHDATPNRRRKNRANSTIFYLHQVEMQKDNNAYDKFLNNLRTQLNINDDNLGYEDIMSELEKHFDLDKLD